MWKREGQNRLTSFQSEKTLRTSRPGSGRAVLHRHAGTDAPQHGGKHQRPGEVVEYFPIGGFVRRGHISSLVVEEVFRGELVNLDLFLLNFLDRRSVIIEFDF